MGCHFLLQGIVLIEPGSVTSPVLAGGFFTTSSTWEAQVRPSVNSKKKKRVPQKQIIQWPLLICGIEMTTRGTQSKPAAAPTSEGQQPMPSRTRRAGTRNSCVTFSAPTRNGTIKHSWNRRARMAGNSPNGSEHTWCTHASCMHHGGGLALPLGDGDGAGAPTIQPLICSVCSGAFTTPCLLTPGGGAGAGRHRGRIKPNLATPC